MVKRLEQKGHTMKRTLVIDDAAMVRMYHRQTLEGAGFTVEEAGNGIEALEKALITRFDIFLVDVNMPKMDGYSFIREIRSREELRDIPAIMISTEADPEDEEKAFRAGANLYMIKPVKPEALCLNVSTMTS